MPLKRRLLPTAKALTIRELSILELIGAGRSSNEIAQQLHVSLHTIGNHRKHICAKLNRHSTAELVIYALRNIDSLKREGNKGQGLARHVFKHQASV